MSDCQGRDTRDRRPEAASSDGAEQALADTGVALAEIRDRLDWHSWMLALIAASTVIPSIGALLTRQVG